MSPVRPLNRKPRPAAGTAPAVPGRARRRGRLWGLALFTLALLAPVGTAAGETWLEDLHFSVDVLMLRDAVRVRLTFQDLGDGKYRAEISGELQGALKAIGGERRDQYRTDMAWRHGRLLPLVYREESRRRKKRHLKEYRFDYARGKLEMWQEKGGKMVRKWETPLTEAIYDPLSAFYNCRLGLLGPIRDGQVFKVAGIPYPKPEEMEVRIGPETPQGRKAMISVTGLDHRNKPGPVFALLDQQMVPRHAWTRVWGLGKITGELLPGGKGLQGLPPEVAASRGAGPAPGS